jgi:hypothetical protein
MKKCDTCKKVDAFGDTSLCESCGEMIQRLLEINERILQLEHELNKKTKAAAAAGT